MTKELLQQALDALPLATYPFRSELMLYRSDVLAALAQPVQPADHMPDTGNMVLKRQPLTHEQRVDLLTAFEEHKHKWHAHAILIDMVEAAHNINEQNK